MPRDYALAAATIFLVGTLCLFAPPLVRRALLEGLHCVGRHAAFWRIPAFLGLGYALFQLAAAAMLHARIGDLREWAVEWNWNAPPGLPVLLTESALPALERTASVFTIFTATFPLSALFALLLVFNFRGLLAESANALRKRIGRWFGLLATLLLSVTILCAILKPAVYLLLPELSEHLPFAALLAIDFLSTLFELLLGIFLLTWLMLLAYAWKRGLSFDQERLLRVAVRRSGFVLKWSLVLAALFSALILFPAYAGLLANVSDEAQLELLRSFEGAGRLALLAVLFVFAPVQAILVFHNESLRSALRDSMRTVRTQWPSLLPFFVGASACFLVSAGMNAWLDIRLDVDTSLALVAKIPFAIIEAMLAGWLIASWVCLYKSLPAGRKEITP